MEENIFNIDFSDEAYRERFELAAERIEEFPGELKGNEAEYFAAIRHITELCRDELANRRCNKAVNEALYEELTEEGFRHSFLNTEYAAAGFGSLGTLMSAWYLEFRGIIPFSYENRIKDMTVLLETSIQLYAAFEERNAIAKAQAALDQTASAATDAGTDESASGSRQTADSSIAAAAHYDETFTAEINEIVYSYIYDYADEFIADELRYSTDPSYSFARDIVMNADLSNTGDDSYLYSFGEWITDEELLTAKLMSELPEETVERMARAYTDGYIKGFAMTGKDVSIKSTVSCYMPLGFERFMRAAIKQFEAAGLSTVISRNPAHLINRKPNANIKPGFYGASNSQCDYDHKEDMALFWGDKLKARRLEAYAAACEDNAALLKEHSGHACVEIFGRKGQAPEPKQSNAAYTEHQHKVTREYTFKAHEIIDRYMPDEETSFTIIAWPTASIAGEIHAAAADSHSVAAAAEDGTHGYGSGISDTENAAAGTETDSAAGNSRAAWSSERYREIFDKFIDINTLPEDRWRQIQQCLIDALDKAEYVEVKGVAGNDTDIRVQLHSLKDPDKETNFENCLADVNIPAGEVFTSPLLKGTNGQIHAGFVYIGGYLFENLRISFEDGRVSDYSCSNYADAEQGRELIRQVIFKNRETLPMGEFAIGTNTIAYVAALKYGIADRMPVLIAEKTGPHFAVGDTCYSYEEDMATFNPDGKQITARENECSALRHTEPEKAYFSVHTDITLPYSELGSIKAAGVHGSISIIENGRFVLPGTEELNAAFED